MDELLEKLLSAEVLSEDTKSQIEQAFNKKIDEAIEVARAAATAEVTADLKDKFIAERDTLIEALDEKIDSVLAEEISELKGDIENFRDLEAEYAQKLVEAKSEMADKLKQDLGVLVEKLDAFLEIRLKDELDELREDIDRQRENQLGRRIFEAFGEEFKKFYVQDGSAEGKLNEATERLTDTMQQLEKAERTIAKLVRESKMEKVLQPLAGRTREIMEAILNRVDTPMLEEAYDTYIGRVLKDSDAQTTSEKENKVLAEGKKEEPKGVIKTGDEAQKITESKELVEDVQQNPRLESELRQLLVLAGVKSAH